MMFIVAYHFLRSSGWLTGGFVFIELFLLVSGFLMTAKILREYQKTGQVAIGRFILRRILRLWPLVILTIVISLASAFFTPRELLAGLRQDSLAGATFSTNIVEIVNGRGYEDTISPNLFGHLWFVALELQLCVLLPIILSLTIMSAGGRKAALRRSLVVTVLLAAASVLLSGVYGGYWQKADRAYFAPDTQAYAFFMGAALAIWRALHPLKERRRRFGAGVRLVLSLAGLVTLSCLLRYGEAKVFYWGLPLAALLSLILISSLLRVQRRRTVLPKFCRLAEFFGRYSFGVYLFHYPLMFLVARCFNLALPLRIAIVLALSLVLTLLCEELLALLAKRKLIALLVLFLLIVPATVVLAASPKESPIMQEISQNKTEAQDITIRYVQDFNNSKLEQFLNEAAERTGENSEPVEAVAAQTPNDAKVLVIGDSVCLGAKLDMESMIPGVFVDAEESRGVEKAVPILNQVAASGNIPPIIIVSLTTNERYFSDDLMQGIIDAARGSRVIFVTGYAGPEQPRETQNEAIRNFANNHEGVFYADWWEISHDNWDIMYADHIHLDIEGRKIYAQLLYNTIMNTGGLE
jgi:peptidoglycan/LPS O-acetylase OafA/YrhL